MDLVLAGGEQIRVDATNEPDLFWAVRGGGGSFGVVTALRVRSARLPEISAERFVSLLNRRAQVLRGWLDLDCWNAREMTSVGRLMDFPPIPRCPSPSAANHSLSSR